MTRGHCPFRGLTGMPRDTHRSRVPIVGTPTYEAFAWDRRRALSDFLVFSNLIYVAIGYVYATKGRPGAAALVTLSGLTSFVYHVSRETVARAHTLAHRPAILAARLALPELYNAQCAQSSLQSSPTKSSRRSPS